jgi:site-specific DNA recombinase
VSLTNGPLAYLLRNRVYLGELNHKGASYPGQHAAIVESPLFDAVQAKLTSNLNGRRMQRSSSGALLLGRIFDDRGNRMTPSTAHKGQFRYRYYVSSVLAQGRQHEAGSLRRVSASEIEALVVQALWIEYPDGADEDQRTLIQTRLERVVVSSGSLEIYQTRDPATPIMLPRSPTPTRGRREILGATENHTESDGGIKAEARAVLLRSIAFGRRWLDEVLGGSTPDEIAAREGCTKRHVINTIPLAFLAPDIVRAVIEARLPRGINTKRIAEPELEWSRQWEMLGLRR